MRIEVVGPLVVRADDGAPLTVPGAKERLLLAVLAADAPAAVSADRIVDALWDGSPPATARRSLQAHLVHLRSTLEPGRPHGSCGRYVLGRGSGYVLELDRADLDSLAFADLVCRGRARLAAGLDAAAVLDLGGALLLWRGEPFADWPQASFAEPGRRRLEGLRAAAVTGRIEARLALGEAVDVVPELEELVAGEPLREDWWRLLMLASYRAGRQADALAAGRRVRTLLAAELGCVPGPGLRSMEAAILAQDPSLDAARRTTVVLPRVERPVERPVERRAAGGVERRASGPVERRVEATPRWQRPVVVLVVALVVALVLALAAAVVAVVVAVRAVP